MNIDPVYVLIGMVVAVFIILFIFYRWDTKS